MTRQGPQMEQVGAYQGLKMGPIRSKNGTKRLPQRRLGGCVATMPSQLPRSFLKSLPQAPKMVPRGSHRLPKWSQEEAKIVPKSKKKHYQFQIILLMHFGSLF